MSWRGTSPSSASPGPRARARRGCWTSPRNRSGRSRLDPGRSPLDERCPMPLPLSILDLATMGRSQTVAESLAGTVALAQKAEETGYTRVWYAEHHNMAAIASSATSVLIAHVAAHTRTIRLGSGGVMLPNHSPLTIAEQYGTLETLHPGRID